MDAKVKSGEMDMFISFYIPERLAYMTLTEPLMEFEQVIIARLDAPFMSGISALKGKKVAAARGVKLYDKLFSPYPEIEVVQVDTSEEMFKAVSEFKADALISRTYIAGYVMQNYPNLKIAGIAGLPPEPYYYAVRKDYPELVSIFNKAIASIPREKHEAIVQKWFSVRFEYRPNWSEILKWAFVIGGAFAVILGLSLVWNRRLAREIDKCKQTEEVLAQVAREWQTTFDAANDVIWLLDKEQRVVRSNKTSERFFQRPCSELVGKHCWEIVHGTDQPIPECPILRAKHGLHRETMELKIGESWFGITVDPILDATGQYAGAVHIVSDITDRKRAAAALQASEQEFHSLAEAMPQIVWITRPDGWNIYFNHQWVDYTGLTLEESYGHGWNTPFHPDDQQRAWDAWQNATQNDASYSVECRLRRADGDYRWWLIRGVPLRDASGKILKWFGTCTDIEDIKQAEDALRQKVEELRASNDELELFNRGMVGRELRMIELKQEINELCRRLGEPTRHETDPLETDDIPGTGPAPAA